MIFLVHAMLFLHLSNGFSQYFGPEKRLTISPFGLAGPSFFPAQPMADLIERRQMSRRIERNNGSKVGYWQYYQKLLRKPTERNVTVADANSTNKKSFSSFFEGLPLSLSSGIKRYPINPAAISTGFLQYGNTNDGEVDSDEVGMSVGLGYTSRRPMLPIVNGPSLDSDEDISDRRKVPHRNPHRVPSFDKKWQQAQQQMYPNRIHENQGPGWSPAATPIPTPPPMDLTTPRTTQISLPTFSSRPVKNVAYEDDPAEKLSSLPYRRPYYPPPPLVPPPPLPPPAPVLPIVGGKPAKVINPYVNIAFSPQMNVLGMRIQKNFGLHLGIKIVRPVRRPFAFLTPLIGGAISPAAPPPNFVPLANPQPAQPPPFYQYQRPLSGAVEQDIVISRKGGDSGTALEDESKDKRKLSLLERIRLKNPAAAVEGRA